MNFSNTLKLLLITILISVLSISIFAKNDDLSYENINSEPSFLQSVISKYDTANNLPEVFRQKKRTVYYFPAKRYQVTYSKRPRKVGYVLFLGTIKSTTCTYRRPTDIYYVTKRINEQFQLHVEAYYKSNLGLGFLRRIDPPSQARWNNVGNLSGNRASTARNSRSTIVTVTDYSLKCF